MKRRRPNAGETKVNDIEEQISKLPSIQRQSLNKVLNFLNDIDLNTEEILD